MSDKIEKNITSKQLYIFGAIITIVLGIITIGEKFLPLINAAQAESELKETVTEVQKQLGGHIQEQTKTEKDLQKTIGELSGSVKTLTNEVNLLINGKIKN